VYLPAAIPVYLFYWTAWTTDEGVVHFRRDIYDRDTVLDKALRETVSALKGVGKAEVVMKRP
jgi:murein L,D-transpeptidase YcbB/YkuD